MKVILLMMTNISAHVKMVASMEFYMMLAINMMLVAIVMLVATIVAYVLQSCRMTAVILP